MAVAAPSQEQSAYALLQQNATGVRDDELSVLASGQRADPSVALSDRATRALDEFNVLLNQLQARGTDVAELRSELEKLQVAYLDRISWQPPVNAVLFIPWPVISLRTLIAIGVYPAGSSARDKWIQARLSK